MTLSELHRAVAALRELPAAQRRAAVGDLAPTLEQMAADARIDPTHRINTLTRALRAITSQRTPRPASVPDALAKLRAALHADRGPGRPAIGPATTVRLPETVYSWLDETARRHSLLDADGQPRRPAVVRVVLEEAAQVKTATVAVNAGARVRLSDDVPFDVEIIEPPGQHTVAYRYDGRLCSVVVDDAVGVVATSMAPHAVSSATGFGADGSRIKVKLQTSHDSIMAADH